MGALCAFALVSAVHILSCDGALLAPMMSITVTKNSEVLISLPGYDPAGQKLTTTITSVPSVGSLFQISQIFSDYGYEPKRGLAIPTANASNPVAISGSRNRFIYTPPAQMNEPTEKWAWFTYTVSDRTSTSAPGIVWLLPPHRRPVYSDFSVSLEGWTVTGNGARAQASPAGGLSYEAFSRGVLNHYVLATDAEINTNKRTKNDDTLWYFVAPAKFWGMHNIAYGGALTFAMSSAAGDFSPANVNTDVPVIIIECASCASGSGIRLVKYADATLLPLDGKAREVSIPLTEGVWRKDPKNTLLSWQAPTQCEMVEVLGAVSSLRILGDHTRWYESVAIDRVAYVAGTAGVPLACASTYY